jgi:hypothetical protein
MKVRKFPVGQKQTDLSVTADTWATIKVTCTENP